MKKILLALFAILFLTSFIQAANESITLQVIDIQGKKIIADQAQMQMAPTPVLIKSSVLNPTLAGKIQVIYNDRETVLDEAFKESFEKEITLPKKGSYAIKATAVKVFETKDEKLVKLTVLSESFLGKYVPNEVIFLEVVGILLTLILLLSTLTRQASSQ